MAANLTVTDLRKRFSIPESLKEDSFSILKAIASLVSVQETEATGREMLLRAFEQRGQFGTYAQILDSIARSAGLFPYVNTESLDVRELIAYEAHRPTNLGYEIVFHREQADVYHMLLAGKSVILSAPTSFGKSRIVDAMIATERFKNIVVVVPTLALIDETRRRLSVFADRYKIVTHVSQQPSEHNVFIFTAERVVAFEQFPKIDFFVVDEFYKIGALDEDESRTVTLNQAFYRLLKNRCQFYMLGPNIDRIPSGLEEAYRCSFYSTQFSTVAIDLVRVPGGNKDINRLLELLKTLDDPTLIYCSSPQKANEVARAMIDGGIGIPSNGLKKAASWIRKTYHREWVFGRGLEHGIGIHHGRIPRSLAQFVVRAFNAEKLRFLICTSSLIEGVNTKAKNVVIWDSTIANRPLDFFTFNNIRGRSGRMFQHFVGRVYLFQAPPAEELQEVKFPLFTQDSSAPESLLIHLDSPDLTANSKLRMQKYAEQPLLSIELLRANQGVDPQLQITLARQIEGNANLYSRNLAWQRFPTYDQLLFACNLIWNYLVDAPRKRQGVVSGKQLAFLTWQLYKLPSVTKRIAAALKPGKRAVPDPDDAVEAVLQFDRTWAGFELPRYLSALSAIQREVLSKQRLPFGDYSVFAAQVESLFQPTVVAALDEYGIPTQVAMKLVDHLPKNGNLDSAFASLKDLDFEMTKLTAFEEDLVTEARSVL